VWAVLVFLLVTTLSGAENISALEFEQRIFDLTNKERIARGLSALSYEISLATLAQYHSRNMAWEGFFDHVDKAGLDVEGRQKKLIPELLHGGIGENLFYLERGDRKFDPAQIVNGWMESPGHRQNILEPSFTHMGIGVFLMGNKLYSTQVLAIPLLKLSSAPLDKYSRKNTYQLSFEYLSAKPRQDLQCLLATPDPTTRIKAGEQVYYEGVFPLEIAWKDERHFELQVEFNFGKGDYSLHVGWGEYYYPGLLTFTVN
jgi:hypothetical protein